MNFSFNPANIEGIDDGRLFSGDNPSSRLAPNRTGCNGTHLIALTSSSGLPLLTRKKGNGDPVRLSDFILF
jgi:hypothetical protein